MYEMAFQSVLDHSTFYANLTEANQSKNPPVWLKEYDAKVSKLRPLRNEQVCSVAYLCF